MDKKDFGSKSAGYGKTAGKTYSGKEYGKKDFNNNRHESGKPGEKKSFGEKSGFRKTGNSFGSGNNNHFSRNNRQNYGKAPSRGNTPPSAVQSPSPARKAAFDVLSSVHQKDAFASLALNLRLSGDSFKPEDRRLTTALVYGVLENELKLDQILSTFLDRKPEIIMMDILRMGAYQILMMDRIPASAAVNDAVNLAKQAQAAAKDGHDKFEISPAMVNAVLRNLIRKKDELKEPVKEEDPDEWLSYQSSTPLWLVRKIKEAYGDEEAEKLLLYREASHPITVRPNMTRLTDEEFDTLLQGKGWNAEPGKVPHARKVSGTSSVTLDKDYADGLFSIEGESSMLAAMAMQVRPGMKVLDACAAPGGKSAYLCEAMQLTGRVFAWELHEKRTALIEGVKRRLKLENLRVVCRDATVYREDLESSFDAVLLDAPCCGLGVMLQKPDIKYRLKEESIPEIVNTQKALLETVCRYVKRGGRLVYSTCSLLPEENSEQIRAFLERHPEYEIAPLPDGFPKTLREEQTENGLQILPHRDELEGFFIAVLRRVR